MLDEKIVSTLQKWLGIKRNAGSAAHRDVSDDFVWDTPILFDEVSTPEIPASLLPGVYGSFASALAEAAEVPEAMTTMAVLGAISATVAKRFVVSPQSGWEEPVNLYILQALPPANLKSLVTRSVVQPIDSWEFNECLALEPAIRLATSKRKNEESQIQSLRAKAGRKSLPPERQELFNEVNRLEAELTEIPVPPQVYINDVTPETLTTVVSEQKGRIAIISDEGGIFEVMAGLYSKGQANYDILLKGIDGGRVRLRRKDRDLDLNPYITLLLVVQPQIIRNMADKKAFQGRGLLERFLYVLPKSRLGYRSLSTQPMPEPVRKQYDQALQKLLNIAPIIERGGFETPRMLHLDAAALERWTAFRHEVEAGLRPDDKFSACQGWGGKIAGFTLRIAGLLQIAEHGGSILSIDSTNMERAVQMARLLVEHALAAFGLMRNDEAAEDAQAVYAWLCQLGQPQFRRTECQRKFHGRFTGKKRLDAALGILIDRSIISPLRLITTTEGKRQTGFYEVNPAISSFAPHVS
jgi:putative DNA primase/helicase